MKIRLLTVFLLTVLLISMVGAYSNFDIKETWRYSETITGSSRGFTLTHTSSVPRDTCGYYDWSANPRYCGPQINTNNQDRQITSAFQTFQRDSQKQLDIEKQAQMQRYQRYNYFSYSYPYYGYYSFW